MKKKKTGPITGELAIRLIAIKKLCEQNSGGKWKCPVATSSVEWEGRNYWLVQHPELGDGVSELAEPNRWRGSAQELPLPRRSSVHDDRGQRQLFDDLEHMN